MIYGGQEFAKKLKDRFLANEKNIELPQHNSLFRTFAPELLFAKATEILKLDVEMVRNNKKRLQGDEKEKRDLLIYLLWKTGQLSNQEIGNLIGLSYSMVSRSVKATNDKILSDKGYRRQYQAVSSEFKV